MSLFTSRRTAEQPADDPGDAAGPRRRVTRGGPSTEQQMLRRTALRLGIQAGTLVAAIVVALTGVAVAVVITSQRSDASALLGEAIARADDVEDPPAGVWLVIQTAQGSAASRNLPPGLPDTTALSATTATGATEVAERYTAGTDYLIQTSRRDGATIQGGLDLSANHSVRDRLVTALLACGALGLLLATGAGTWLGMRAARPLSTALGVQRRFVADASHELRTPLTLLSTRAQLLRRHLRQGHPLEATMAEAAAVIADSDHLTAILEDLLLVADPAATPGSDDVVDLGALASEVAAAAAAAAQERGITITTPDPDNAVATRGSAPALRRALTALLDNAVGHAHHHVLITTAARGPDAVIEVGDDGPGIDPTIAPRLFDRFATSRAGAGEPANASAAAARPRRYGIGLALVAEIAARHQGHISAPATDHGALLRLTLPAHTPA